MLQSFKDDLKKLSCDVIVRYPNCVNEEQTKQSLILPLLDVLGYDIYDPSEIVMEYQSDVPGIKKSKFESADYAVQNAARKVVLLIEAKSVDEDLDKHGSQLFRYFTVSECQHAILTNGLEYRFFSDLDKDNIMDQDPYRIVNITDLSDDDMIFISKFAKDNFSSEEIKEQASKDRYAQKLLRKIEQDVIEDPSDEFIRLLLSDNIYTGQKNATVIKHFKPLVKEMLDAAVKNKYNIETNLTRNSESPKSEKTDDVAVVLKRNNVKNPLESYDARGISHPDGTLTVLAGSIVSSVVKEYADSEYFRSMRKEHVDEYNTLIDDVLCNTPSMGGVLVRGKSTNGWDAWRIESTGQKLYEYRNRVPKKTVDKDNLDEMDN